MAKSFRIGIYNEEESFISSVRVLIEKGVKVYEVFTPYPVHEVFEMLKSRTRIPVAAYFLGLVGAASTVGFLVWACVKSWPIVYGGKPFNSFPSFVVITVVITILFVGIGSLALFSFSAKILPGRDNTVFDARAMDDRFVIVIETPADDDPEGDRAATLMKENGATDVLKQQFDKIIR